MILDITSMVAEFGRIVRFVTYNYTFSNGEYTLTSPASTTDIRCGVFPLKEVDESMGVEGSRLKGAIRIYTRKFFSIPNTEDSPEETRVLFEGKSYRLVARKKWKDYYLYYAELLRVNDELPA